MRNIETVKTLLPPALVDASLPDVSSQDPARCGAFRTLKVRIKPDAKQVAFFNAHIGAIKFAYNCTVAYWVAIHEQWVKDGRPKKAYIPGSFEFVTWFRRLRKDMIADGELWLDEVNSSLMDIGVFRAADAINCFLSGTSRFPRFKKRNDSVRWNQVAAPQSNIISLGRLRVPAIFHRHLPKDARIIAVTVKRQARNWYASILYETKQAQKNIGSARNGKHSSVGIDLGLTTFATLSNGEQIENPRPLKKHLKRLRRQQRHFARSQKGSNRRKRWLQNVARLHAKVANTRKYHAQQAAFRLVRDFQTICIEDLNVAGMVQNKHLARSISDAGLSIFTSQLEQLCKKYNRQLLVVNRFYPSSKTCSNCGAVNRELSLNDREWTCQSCCTRHNRDANAATNIEREGLKAGAGKLRLNDVEGADVRPIVAAERSVNRQVRNDKNLAKVQEVNAVDE